MPWWGWLLAGVFLGGMGTLVVLYVMVMWHLYKHPFW